MENVNTNPSVEKTESQEPYHLLFESGSQLHVICQHELNMFQLEHRYYLYFTQEVIRTHCSSNLEKEKKGDHVPTAFNK